MMNYKKLLTLLVLMFWGYIMISVMIRIVYPPKTYIRGECMREYPSDYLVDKACAEAICGKLGLIPSNSGCWYEPLIYCKNKSGGELKVNVADSGNPFCQKMSTQRINLRLCCDSRGGGY